MGANKRNEKGRAGQGSNTRVVLYWELDLGLGLEAPIVCFSGQSCLDYFLFLFFLKIPFVDRIGLSRLKQDKGTALCTSR